MKKKKSERNVVIGGKTFIFKRFITKEKKEELEKHSQANIYYLFKKGIHLYKLYIRTDTSQTTPSKYNLKNKEFHKQLSL